MSAITLPHHMRMAALQCNFEGDESKTLLVPGLWQEFGFNVEQLFHTHAELYNAVFDKAKHGALLERYLAEAHAKGLGIILYMNCHILLDSQKHMASEWGQVDRAGQHVRAYGTYYAPCLNSSWVDHFAAALGSLKEYDIQGIFFDGPSSGQCFCPRCDERFRAEHGVSIKESSDEQLKAFALGSRTRFIGDMYRKVKETNPDWASYINVGLMHSGASAVETATLLSYNDIIGTEGGFQFYGPPAAIEIWRCGANAKLVDAVAGDKPGVIFMAGDHKPWSWYLHTPAETILCYASALANGCSVWYGIHCSTDNLDSPAGVAAREMVRFDKAYAELYEQTESVADIAVFFSFDTAKRYASSGEQTDFYQSEGQPDRRVIGNYSQSFNGAYGALFRSGVPFDIVTDLDLSALSKYSVIVVPTLACMSDAVADALREYVRQGGVLVSDSETGLYDEALEKREDFALADVFGAHFEGYRSFQSHDYAELSDHSPLVAAPTLRRIPVPLVATEVAADDTVEVLARLCPPLAGRYAGRPEVGDRPFIVKNRFGKGFSYYFAGTCFELYLQYGIVHYREILEHILAAHASPVVSLSHASGAVEFTVRRCKPSGDLLVHLVNYTGAMTRPIEKVVPLSGLSLKVQGSPLFAKELVSDTPLAISAEQTVHLRGVGEFAVVLLRDAVPA